MIKKGNKKEIHLLRNYYLTSDKLQFIVYQKEKITKSKKPENIGKLQDIDFKYMPTIDQVCNYLLKNILLEDINPKTVKSFNDIKEITINAKKEIKEMIRKY